MENLISPNNTSQSSCILLVLLVLSVLNISFSFLLQPFQYIDELICVFLFFHGVIYSKLLVRKEFLYFVLVLLFFIGYSFVVGNNVIVAMFRDALQFLKPFTCFYVAYYANIRISNHARNIIANIGFIVCVILVCIAPFINEIYPNTTSYYHALTMPGMLYLIFSQSKNKYKYFILFLLPGLLSFRSKFVTELILYIYFLFLLKKKMKFSLITILGLCFMAVIAIWLNWEKFNMYFNDGLQDDQVRTLLYVVSFYLAKAYFPFGSGLGTFGTDASGMYYSPIYKQYGLNMVWGCSPGDYGTNHSFFMDTFYPVIIGELGLVGCILFVMFFVKRWNEIKGLSPLNKKFFLILMTYVLIENIASSSFLGATTVPIMFLVGFSNNKNTFLCQK